MLTSEKVFYIAANLQPLVSHSSHREQCVCKWYSLKGWGGEAGYIDKTTLSTRSAAVPILADGCTLGLLGSASAALPPSCLELHSVRCSEKFSPFLFFHPALVPRHFFLSVTYVLLLFKGYKLDRRSLIKLNCTENNEVRSRFYSQVQGLASRIQGHCTH